VSGDVSPLDRAVEHLGECSRVEQVAAEHLLVDIARPWPNSPARTFVTTVADAMLAGVEDLEHVVRCAAQEYHPRTGQDADTPG